MMNKKTYLLLGVLFASLLVSGIVIAEAQNYTLTVIKVWGENSHKYLEDADLKISCDGDEGTVQYIDNLNKYIAIFENELCPEDSVVKVEVDHKGVEKVANFTVISCSGNVNDCVSPTNENNVVSLAYGKIEISDVVPAPVVKKSSGSSAKKVVKNNTVMVAPVSSESTDSVEPELNADNAVAPEETLNPIENSEETTDDQTAPVTGGVIGALKSGAGIIAVVFIAGILVSYVYVRRKRNSYKGSYY